MNLSTFIAEEHGNRTILRTWVALQEGEAMIQPDGSWDGALIEYVSALASFGNFSLILLDDADMENVSTAKSPYYVARDLMINGSLDFMLDAKRVVDDPGVHFMLPFLYSALKRIFIVDIPLVNGTDYIDYGKVFNVFHDDLWLLVGGVLLVLAILGAVKSWVDGSAFGMSLAQSFGRVWGYAFHQSTGFDSHRRNLILFGFSITLIASLFSSLILTSIAFKPGYKPPFYTSTEMYQLGYQFLTEPALGPEFSWIESALQPHQADYLFHRVNKTEYRKMSKDLDTLRHKYVIQAWSPQTKRCDFFSIDINFETREGKFIRYSRTQMRRYSIPIAEWNYPMQELMHVLNLKAKSFGLDIALVLRRDGRWSRSKALNKLSQVACASRLPGKIRPMKYSDNGLKFHDVVSINLAWAGGIACAVTVFVLEFGYLKRFWFCYFVFSSEEKRVRRFSV